jgi:hypothetical protein
MSDQEHRPSGFRMLAGGPRHPGGPKRSRNLVKKVENEPENLPHGGNPMGGRSNKLIPNIRQVSEPVGDFFCGDNSNGHTWPKPCVFPARDDLKDIAEWLVKGADINATDRLSGYTPLHWAAIGGNKDMVELLPTSGLQQEFGCSRYRQPGSIFKRRAWPRKPCVGCLPILQ